MLTWLIGLTQPVVSGFGLELSWKDLILVAGGIFLLYKATHEMHKAVEEDGDGPPPAPPKGSFAMIIVQIILIDMVFSIDSIVTAIGMAQRVEVMIAAVVIAVGIMYVASGTVAAFIARHPTTKMLALAFLLLIGVTLVADGLGFHIDKGYIYAAMAFATAVEAINIFARQQHRKGRAATVPAGAAATAAVEPPLPVKAKPKSTVAARAQARPKSAPRQRKSQGAAIVITAHGGPEVLRFEERPVGDPGPGQIRIRQHAIGVNFVDVYQRTGLYALRSRPSSPVMKGQARWRRSARG